MGNDDGFVADSWIGRQVENKHHDVQAYWAINAIQLILVDTQLLKTPITHVDPQTEAPRYNVAAATVP
jgi:hypothetical protein